MTTYLVVIIAQLSGILTVLILIYASIERRARAQFGPVAKARAIEHARQPPIRGISK